MVSIREFSKWLVVSIIILVLIGLGLLIFLYHGYDSSSMSLSFRQCPKNMSLSLLNNSKTILFADSNDTKKLGRSEWVNFENRVSIFLENKELPNCSDIANITNLYGRLTEDFLNNENIEAEDISAAHPDLKPGGEWRPSECRARHKIAIIIPYRDRKSHLNRLLNYLIPFLKRQLLDFRFIITEQSGDDLFNKGRIMNAAFKVAQKMNVDCVIFHDVDMFPEDFRIPYSCPDTPRHLGAFVNTLGYEYPSKDRVGGVLAMKMGNYEEVNGFSNLYWGWGGEDNDMGRRILSLNKTIERPNRENVRYTMLEHVKRTPSAPKLTGMLLASAETRWAEDGLNSTNRWSVMSMERTSLFYHLLVSVGRSSVYWRINSCII